jgi:uncharacterized SAM-binding protein YcdF (DUF218 family)
MIATDERPMSVVQSNDGEDGAGPVPAEAAGRRGRLARLVRTLGRLAAAIAAIVAFALALGFLWFVFKVPAHEVALDRNADGIVVLTGGSSRVNDAIALLASGRGRRLLISGVYPATNRGEMLRVLPKYEQLFACCVDLDRTAVNTLGNAIGAKRWAEQQGFRSLIIVTSAYHMPRAMAELSHQLPDVKLIPYPVVTGKLRTESWWSHAAIAKLLLLEYVKYIVAVIRIHVDPGVFSTALSHRFSALHPAVPAPRVAASGT